MHRLRRFRRIPKSTIVLIALASLSLVITHYFVHGSQPRYVHFGKDQSVPVDDTRGNEYLRTALWAAAGLFFGYGIFRWNAASERLVDDSDARPRAFGDSVVDARTQVDPAIGIRPVNTSRDR